MAETNNPTKPNTLNQTVRLVRLTRVFQTRLAEHPVFKQQKIGVAEWSFIHALLENPKQRGGQIATRLGLTAQRGAQIVASLTKDGLISATASSDDTRKKDLTVTDLGKTSAGAIDEGILNLINGATGEHKISMATPIKNIRALIATLNTESGSTHGKGKKGQKGDPTIAKAN